MNIDLRMDVAKTESRISRNLKAAQMALDAKVLQDSNYYIPEQSGSLKKSGITSTVIGSGCVKWDTEYAKEQYYGKPNKSHQKNPNARMMWFEVAKSVKLKEWEKLANDTYNKDT